MAKKNIIYNGIELSEDWVQKIKNAQEIKTITIKGKEYKRIAYGDEKENWGANDRPCGDCAVAKGQLHVPNCDIEECPSCGGQAIGCNCEYEGDE